MIFEIDFNREVDDKFLESIGAKWYETGSVKYAPFEILKIEINSFEELEEILKKVDKEKEGMYSAIVSFDPPCIFLDKEV